MTLDFRLMDAGASSVGTATVSPTYDVTGTWSAPNGDSENVKGTLLEFPDNGAFDGVFSRPGVNVMGGACIAEAAFMGAVTPTTLWLDRRSDSTNSCTWAEGFDTFSGRPAQPGEPAPTPPPQPPDLTTLNGMWPGVAVKMSGDATFVTDVQGTLNNAVNASGSGTSTAHSEVFVLYPELDRTYTIQVTTANSDTISVTGNGSGEGFGMQFTCQVEGSYAADGSSATFAETIDVGDGRTVVLAWALALDATGRP